MVQIDLDGPALLLVDQWLALLAPLSEQSDEMDREIDLVPDDVPKVELMMTIPEVSPYSGSLVLTKTGWVDRFDEAKQW